MKLGKTIFSGRICNALCKERKLSERLVTEMLTYTLAYTHAFISDTHSHTHSETSRCARIHCVFVSYTHINISLKYFLLIFITRLFIPFHAFSIRCITMCMNCIVCAVCNCSYLKIFQKPTLFLVQ